MFIRVQLLNGLRELLWYSVPEHLAKVSLRNQIVQVPVRKLIIPAIVIEEYAQKPFHITFECKDICSIVSLPPDNHYNEFIAALGSYYQVNSLFFIKRLYRFLADKKENEYIKSNNENYDSIQESDVILTEEQQKVSDFLIGSINAEKYTPIVLHGITGSGKTEVYKKAIIHALNTDKSALFLLPEVTLAIAFENRLKKEIPSVPIFGFHSGKTPKEKNEIWNNLKNGKKMLLIGVHLPILLPIPNLGLIIIDEEHDSGYQEKKHPKINSKEAAILRAHYYKIPIILGSATPSIATLYNVKAKKWSFFQLKKRFFGMLPKVTTVFLTHDKQRKEFWISKELEVAIQNRLCKREQTILFINRRGFSFFVQCKECSFIFMCSNCSVSLTVHEDERLLCHYCGVSRTIPLACPTCKEKSFLKKGIGTQKVVFILQKMFPNARIARADLDTTVKKKVWQQTITDMHQGNIDILVGTQTITKGFHFPFVTLVGVLWADLQLNFPVYNATEVALQQLIQVAGRAGRYYENSMVIIQTMADHTLFKYLNEIDYLGFYAHEISMRESLNYPPCGRLVELELKHIDEVILEKEACILASMLDLLIKKHSLLIQVLGPARPSVSKIKNVHFRKIYLKGSSFSDIAWLFDQIDKKTYSSSLYFTPNPSF